MALALWVYMVHVIQRSLPGAAWNVGGVALTIIAAAVQADAAVGFTLFWQFDHNGVFHLVQIVSVFCLYTGLRRRALSWPAICTATRSPTRARIP